MVRDVLLDELLAPGYRLIKRAHNELYTDGCVVVKVTSRDYQELLSKRSQELSAAGALVPVEVHKRHGLYYQVYQYYPETTLTNYEDGLAILRRLHALPDSPELPRFTNYEEMPEKISAVPKRDWQEQLAKHLAWLDGRWRNWLKTQTMGVMHGDIHCKNFVGQPWHMIDLENLAWGPAGYDVASLTKNFNQLHGTDYRVEKVPAWLHDIDALQYYARFYESLGIPENRMDAAIHAGPLSPELAWVHQFIAQ